MESSSPSSRGARRPSLAPAEILRATESLLLDQGVEGLSIRKVAERSGYTAPTIYHHFGDKQGLLHALLEERFRQAHDVMRAIPRGTDPALYLREMALAFLRFALENPDHYRLLTTPRVEEVEPVPSAEASRELVKEALAQLAQEGTLATNVEAAFQVTWALLHGLISLRSIHPGFEFVDDLFELALDVVERGLLRSVRS
jgi:AcrR family transcriptional regulator